MLYVEATSYHFLFQVRERVPALEKTSMLQTLKDHLHQCPSKLAEEMVRCMSLVYCWLCSAASVKIEKNQSPLLSRPNVLQPPHGTEDAQDWSGKSMVEISWISTDKKKFSHASYAINNYRLVLYNSSIISYNTTVVVQMNGGSVLLLSFLLIHWGFEWSKYDFSNLDPVFVNCSKFRLERLFW